ncbi:hypothetical protein KGA66_27095, partial [Actinocrinis puniceicyclus]
MTLDLASLTPGELASLARVTGALGQLANAGTCENPIRLVGGRDVIEAATGEMLDSSTGREITVSCGNRRASKCAYCSTLYKYDAYNLVASGLRGGKDVPATVAQHPAVFLTLTAPSFGPVHRGPDKSGQARSCHPRRDGSGCFRWHAKGDPLIGTPLDPTSYDYAGHVLFNALAAKLWSVTTTEIRRALARTLGITRTALKEQAVVTFAKVAEYQARGVVHFHAVIRIDGPNGPASTPPAWATVQLLKDAIEQGTARATVAAPESRALGEYVFGWGEQVRADPITSATLGGDGQVNDVTVARYIAKYATKSTEITGAELPRLACRTCDGTGRIVERHLDRPPIEVPCRYCHGTGRTLDLDQWKLTDHARRLIETCWLLGGLPELADLRLRQWAHMLGFRGHFATKSRTYSTTFGALRQERADYTRALDPELAALADSPDVIVINHWSYAGPADVTG